MTTPCDVFLPVTVNRMSLWPGHQPGTRTRLYVILDQAALAAGGLSLAERALFAVCEFWSAVATQSLECHLGVDPEQRLRSAAMVYAAMGARRPARAMEKTLGELARTHDGRQRQQRIAALELVMLRARGSIDELIARFARRLVPQLLESERRPALAVAAAAVASMTRAPRRDGASVHRPPAVAVTSTRARSYVGWRTENPGAGQHD